MEEARLSKDCLDNHSAIDYIRWMPPGAQSIALLEDNNQAPLSSPRHWSKSTGPSRRGYVVACLCSLSFLTIVDRVCISAAKTPMSAELRLTDTAFGWVFGAFAVGYTLMMVPSGWLADRFGPRKTLASIVLLWSVLTAATGLVRGAAILLLVRFLFGLAEAGAFPGAARAISNWLPAQERGLALGLLNTGSRLGAAFGLSAMSFCILSIGWRFSFMLLGVAGILWSVLWFWWFRDRPGSVSHWPINDSARTGTTVPPASPFARLARTRLRGEASAGRSLLRSPSVYIILFQYFASQFTFFICFSWLLPYLETHYGLSGAVAGLYAAIPLLCGAVANWISGATVDAIYRKGHWKRSRRLPAMCGFGLACVALIAAPFVPSLVGFVLLFALATFGVDLTLSPSWTVCADIGGRYVGALSGAMNMMGSLSSFGSAILFPGLFALTGNIKTYFYLAAFLDLVAMSCWGFVLNESNFDSELPFLPEERGTPTC
ncbi:MAG: transporter, family, glucarate transporter [Acidobacteriaceae bacterium]|nr:transporter, family, glucarate transporter [Acidobacteriaceae bacterium]